jgi:hypothetical protein
VRDTGPLFTVLKGDQQRAQQYVGMARTLLGRMKSYLGGSDGAKTWALGNGVTIRTLVAGDVTKVTIDAPPAAEDNESGYYFVYLFGSFTDEPAKAYGWRVERSNDKVTPLKGMPFALYTDAENPATSTIAPSAGGRIRCSADNYARLGEIAVLVNLYADNFTTTSNPVSSRVLTYRADPMTGKLTFGSVVDAAGPLFEHQSTELFYSTGLYATQAPGKYIVCSNDFVIDNYTGGDAQRRVNQAYLFDTDSNALTYFDAEESMDGASRSVSYAIKRVGMSAHHPSRKIFYTAFTRRVDEGYDGTYFRAYSYTDPAGAPTLLDEWKLTALSGVEFVPFALSVTDDGKALIVLTDQFGGKYTYHTLGTDGLFTGHWFLEPNYDPLDLTGSWFSTYFSRTHYFAGSPYGEGNLVTLPISDPVGTLTFDTFTEPYGASIPANAGAMGILRLRADDFTQGAVLGSVEAYERRKANSCARLLNGKRMFRSLGRQATVSGSSYTYSEVPRLMSHKFKHAATDPWYVPTEAKRVDIALADVADVAGMAKTDRLSGIAIVEPLAGR